jgi:ubiquinone/menaquinone biosynthesis C-methylase UbiE
VQADGERLPFADGSFDLVYCVAALHHALDLGAMVREMARVTGRRGIVAALNEGTRPLTAGGENPEQNVEKEFGINEHVHTLPAYLWAFARARLLPVRIERSEGYEAFAHRTKYQRVFSLRGGKTGVTIAYSLLKGYAGISIYARRR